MFPSSICFHPSVPLTLLVTSFTVPQRSISIESVHLTGFSWEILSSEQVLLNKTHTGLSFYLVLGARCSQSILRSSRVHQQNPKLIHILCSWASSQLMNSSPAGRTSFVTIKMVKSSYLVWKRSEIARNHYRFIKNAATTHHNKIKNFWLIWVLTSAIFSFSLRI